MNIFESERETLSIIERHNNLIRRCISGEIGFPDFLDKYNNFYDDFALDGHESDSAESRSF